MSSDTIRKAQEFTIESDHLLPWRRHMVLICGISVAAIGAMALIGWHFEWRMLTSIRAAYLPMAPTTAIAFLVLGILQALQMRQGVPPWRRPVTLFTTFIAILAFARLIELAGLVNLQIDSRIFQTVAKRPEDLNAAEITLFTEINLLLSSLALMVHANSQFKSRFRAFPGAMGFVILSIGLVFSLGYVYEGPFFYGTPTIPMAFNAALAFVLFGIGLIALTDKATFPLFYFSGSSIRARLLRAYLPFTAATVCLVTWVMHFLDKEATGGSSAALFSALLAVAAIFLVTFICARIARIVGTDLERTDQDLRDAERRSRAYAKELKKVNASLEHQVVRRTAALEASRSRIDQFFTILTSLQNPNSTERIFDLVLAFCQRRGYDLAMLSIVDHEAKLVRAVRAVGEMAAIVPQTVRPLNGEDILALVAREGSVVTIADSRNDPRCDQAAVAATGIRGQIVMPLVSGEVGAVFEVVGVLQVASREVMKPSQRELQALKTLANEAARALAGLRHMDKIRHLNHQLEQRNDELQHLATDLKQIALSEHHARQAQRESEARLRLLLESSGEGVYGLDLAGDCIFVNKAAADMIGSRPQDVLGKNMHALIHHSRTDGSPYPINECPIYRAYKSGQGCRVDDEVLWRLDGKPIPVEYSAYPIRDGDVIKGAVVTFTDITQRKQAEEQLREKHLLVQDAARSEREAHQALKKAQSHLVQSEKLAALGQMVAGVAHEINNPLAFVTNNVAVLQRDVNSLQELLTLYRQGDQCLAEHRPGLMASVQNLAERIDLGYTLGNLDGLCIRSREGLKRIQQIVKDLRDFARLDESDLHDVDINAGIESTLHIIQNQAKKRDITIVAELTPLPPVTCYPAKINQVILNLVANAIDASPSGSAVAVRTAPSDMGVEVQISDKGHGIDPRIRDKIFDPFFTTKPPGQGTGLGLSISYQIIRDHGGTIHVDSALGLGTTFRLQLPLAPPAHNANAQVSDMTTGAGLPLNEAPAHAAQSRAE